MNELRFYKNPAAYPDYTEAITQVGVVREVTPRNMDYHTGYVDIEMTFDEVLSCNYLSIKKDTVLLYAWIMDVEERAGNKLYRVHYQVDAFRTFRSKVSLLSQWVLRDMNETTLKDNLLSSTQSYPDIRRQTFAFDDAGWRTLVIQVRDQKIPKPPYNSTPVQPSPYVMYMKKYQTNSWASVQSIVNLIYYLGNSAQTSNVVTIYSLPGIIYTSAETDSFMLKFATDAQYDTGAWEDGPTISNVYKYSGTIGSLKNSKELLYDLDVMNSDVGKVEHNVQIVLPDAGIMRIPDELLYRYGLSLTRYVDVYSGSVNYMLEAPDEDDPTGPLKPLNVSARAGGSPSIPVLSNPMDTYLSQNQSALTSSLLGDVAMIGTGLFTGLSTGGAGFVAGAPMIAAGVGGLARTAGNVLDANKQSPSNPPAVLGTALAPHYDGQFWLVVTVQHVDNEALVNARFGYPQNTLKNLVLPSTGFVQTQGCNVRSDGTVPLWAIQEINSILDNGIRFY
ncbi:MAG: hypothetical protein EOM07_05140 [Clostridia bacterium]|nr:hypothetical protein [Clostridia bacterium]